MLLIGIKTLSILFYVRHKTNLNILIYYSRKNFISVKKEIFILHLPWVWPTAMKVAGIDKAKSYRKAIIFI